MLGSEAADALSVRELPKVDGHSSLFDGERSVDSGRSWAAVSLAGNAEGHRDTAASGAHCDASARSGVEPLSL